MVAGSYSLNSLKWAIEGLIIEGTTIGDIKGGTRSLDYSSYILHAPGSTVLCGS